MKKQLYTVYVFAKLNTRRFFRDRVAIFFGIAFPLIFLFVFGGIFGKSGGTSFKVAVINESTSVYARQFFNQANNNKVFKVDKTATTFDLAQQKMIRNQLDGTIVFPPSFGKIVNNQPTGNAEVFYTENN